MVTGDLPASGWKPAARLAGRAARGMPRFLSPAVPRACRPGTSRRRGVSCQWRGGRDARGLGLRTEPPEPPPEPPRRSGRAGLTTGRKCEEPRGGRLPARSMVLAGELPRSAGAAGAVSSRCVSGGCGEAGARAEGEGTRVPGRWGGDLIMAGDRPREFLQLPDGSYVRVTSTGDGQLRPAGEPVRPHRARGGSASTAVAFSSQVVADAPGCGLCTWSPREGR
jgi:hypothetical protein